MAHVKHVGRIGALAVALGVGAAVATIPAIAYAAPPGSGSSSTDSSSSPATSSSENTDDSPSTATSSPSDKTGALDRPGSISGRSPSRSTVSEQEPGHTERDDDTALQHAAPATPGRSAEGHGSGNRSRSRTAARANGEPAESVPTPAVEPELPAAVAQTPSAADPQQPSSEQPVARPVAAAEPVTVLEDPSAGAVQSSTDAARPAPAVVANVVTAPLGPLPAPEPQVPVSPSPALWTLLASVRREIGETGQGTVSATPDPVTTPQATALYVALPAITDPASVLTFLVNLVVSIPTFVSRAINIYDLSDWRGWAALVLDYTWGLPGTMIGIVVQTINLFDPNSGYRDDLSFHQNHHVYDRGFHIMGALGLGNVISNAGYGTTFVTESTLLHEATHNWQSRLAGPLFEITYLAWMAAGAVMGTLSWLSDPSKDWYDTVYDAAYWNNPWEVWARDSE